MSSQYYTEEARHSTICSLLLLIAAVNVPTGDWFRFVLFGLAILLGIIAAGELHAANRAAEEEAAEEQDDDDDDDGDDNSGSGEKHPLAA